MTLYSVRDLASGTVMGTFFRDLYPWAGKYRHVAKFVLQQGCLWQDRSLQIAIVAMGPTSQAHPARPLPAAAR